MKKNKGNALTDALIIVLLCLSAISAVKDTCRIQSRRAQQGRIRISRTREDIQ